MSSFRTPVPALLLATSAWGSLFLVSKPLLAVFDPLGFTALRYALATLLLAVLVQVLGHRPWQKLRSHALHLTLMGLAGYGWFSLLVFWGLSCSQPSHGAVIMATMPFTTLLLRWLCDGQRPAPVVLLAALLALLGVATVAQGAAPAAEAAGGPGSLLGDALTLVGTLGWVVYTRGAAARSDHSPLEYTALTAVAATPWLLLLAVLAAWQGWVQPPAPREVLAQLPALLYIAAVPTVLAALAFNFGVRRLGPAVGTLFLNMVPVSVLAVRALQGHPPSLTELLGAALVGLALVLHARAMPRAAADAPARSAARPGAARCAAAPCQP